MLYLAADFVRLLALFYGWWWMFVRVEKERRTVELRLNPALATPAEVREQQRRAEAAGGARPPAPPADADAEADAADANAADQVPAGSPDAVVDRLADAAKMRLLKRFLWLVQAYLAAVVAVLVYRAYSRANPPAAVATMDLVDWLACLGLALTFRLQPENPYFLLNLDDDADTLELLPPAQASAAAAAAAAAAAVSAGGVPGAFTAVQPRSPEAFAAFGRGDPVTLKDLLAAGASDDDDDDDDDEEEHVVMPAAAAPVAAVARAPSPPAPAAAFGIDDDEDEDGFATIKSTSTA
jgi:hypothetical protein